MSSQQHRSRPEILDQRRLSTDHRRLAHLLAPGLSVLDVGCGTGAITMGIAEAVGPAGRVVGVDRDAALIDQAITRCADLPNVRFEIGDAARLGYSACFDVVTAARTLQWIADVGAAIRTMARAARPRGWLVVLDFNHACNAWEPEPPPAFQAFYGHFLDWRTANGWDNELADHLPALFADAELLDIQSDVQDETSVRGDRDFAEKTSIWTEVIDGIGPTLERARICDAVLLQAARDAYEAWRRTDLVRHTLAMKAIVATVPAWTSPPTPA
jgi:SAM-dependent methyltransferase